MMAREGPPMTTTETIRSTEVPVPEWALVEFVERGLLDPAEEILPPLIVAPTPSENPGSRFHVSGAFFDVDAVERVVGTLRMFRHTKGRQWRHQPLNPSAWQLVYVLAPVFGWKGPDGLRIIRYVWVEVPRKNGKTTLVAGIGLVLTAADGEEGAEVYVAAGSKEQAGKMFDPAKAMARACRPLRVKGVRVLKNLIEYPRTGSFMQVVASTGDLAQGASPHGALIDEIHVHRSRDLVDAFDSGVGAREQPLQFLITTADDGKSTTIYHERRTEIEHLAEGLTVSLDTYGAIWAIPDGVELDYTDEESLFAAARAANPGAGVSVSDRYLSEQCRKAMRNPSKRASFERLTLGRRRRSDSAGIEMDRFRMNAGVSISERALRGRRCFGGLDLASSTDFASWSLVFPNEEISSWREHPETGELVEAKVAGVDVLCRLWIPEASVERRKAMRSTIEQWSIDGWVRITPGDAIDFDVIEADIMADAERFDLVEFAYDAWQAEGLRQRLMDGGLDGWKCPQQMAHLAGPWAELERLYLRYGFHYGGNPALEWMARNVVVKSDSYERSKPEKSLSHESIDGMVSATMAVAALIRERKLKTPAATARAAVNEDRSIYEGDRLDI